MIEKEKVGKRILKNFVLEIDNKTLYLQTNTTQALKLLSLINLSESIRLYTCITFSHNFTENSRTQTFKLHSRK